MSEKNGESEPICFFPHILTRQALAFPDYGGDAGKGVGVDGGYEGDKTDVLPKKTFLERFDI